MKILSERLFQGFPVKSNFLISLFCLFGVFAGSRLEALESEGPDIGSSALMQISRGKSAEDAARLALRERRTSLAAAAFSLYLTLEKDPTSPQAVETIIAMGKRSGMRNRTAFILSFQGQRQGEYGTNWIDVLMASKDSAAHELAATVLATRYCYDYVKKSQVHISARKELKLPEKDPDAAAEETTSKSIKKGRTRKAVSLELPAIPDALLEPSPADTYVLALVAAAFSGDARYRERVDGIPKPDRTAAGAALLYLARQDKNLPEAQVKERFKASLSPSATLKQKGAAPDPNALLFDPMLAGGSLACMALAELGDKKYLPLLVQALAAEDLRVQMDAVRAIKSIGLDDAALAAMTKILAQAPWPLLVELCSTLGAHPDKRSVPALLARLEKENGRFRLDLVHALSAIAGEQKGETAQEWKKWAQANLATFTVDPDASKKFRDTTRVQDVRIPSLGFFYGLPIYSDRLVYVVDTSNSMKGPRIDSLRENLSASLDSLQPKKGLSAPKRGSVQFNIVDFGGDLVAMHERGLTSDIKKAKSRAAGMTLSLGTRSFDALECGMTLAGMDTVYFLSDGAPVRGQIEAWNLIIDSMDLLMLYSPVAIWSVAFDPKEGNGEAMTALAYGNFGRHEAPPL